MRLLLTAVVDGMPTDLAVDCDDDAVVEDLSRDLARQLHVRTAALTQPTGGRTLGLVRDDPAQETAPTLFLDGRPLDATERINASPLRHGAIVGVGAPLADVLREPAGAVEIRISGGRGAGRVQRLAAGSYVVGSGRDSAIVLDDPWLPPVACRLDVDIAGSVTVTPDPSVAGQAVPSPRRTFPLTGPIVIPSESGPPEIKHHWWRKERLPEPAQLVSDMQHNIDPQADIPLVHLDRRPLDAPMTWQPGQALVIGPILLELSRVTAPDASLSFTQGGLTLDYNRPPRLLPPPRETKFVLPTEPVKPEKQPLPIVMVLMPAVLAVGMYFYTKSLFSLLFIAMMPVMAVSTFTSGRRQARDRYKKEMADYARRIRIVRQDAYDALVAERALRRRDLADPATLLVTATGPRMRLWERRRTDPDWLSARVGTSDVRSDITMEDKNRESHEAAIAWTAPDVPVAVPLAEAGVTGISGPDMLRRAVGRWIVAQAAVLHSPADLEIVLLADKDSGPEWSWLRWLPHSRVADDAGPISATGNDDDSVQAVVRGLIARVQARRAAAEGSRTRELPIEPVLVVLDGARRIRLLPGMVSLLQDGPPNGVYFLCLDADQRQLPEECRAVISFPDPQSELLRLSVTGQQDIEAVRPDLVDISWCERVARALAPIRDVSTEDLSGSLPTSSRLLSVLGIEEPNPEPIAMRWRNGGRTTSAVIGEGLDGPFAIDIRRDGPHGLVAGTTGSGKSELLQTIIASLAYGNRPDEFTFVLIDYKGGAAFKDCVRLPHTVGMVTDLDGHLTTRALESLGAELRRREHQLAGADAKDIEDYLAGRGPDDAPMPRLMIIIDEFAALVAELPDFVVGLVDIARRGRSLGVHLLLATQRPAGVVSAEIKSNTNLRIALRVTDDNDSSDVIESGDAVTISKSVPGRAYARLGHSSLLPFQSSRVGGRPRGEGGRGAVRSRPFAWANMSAPAPAKADDDEDDMSIPSDLATLVATLQTAAEQAGVDTPPSPWLPPLAETLTLDDAHELDFTTPDRPDMAPLTFGVVDIPSEQARSRATWDPVTGGHLVFVGAPRSGRSTALRAFAGAVAREADITDVHLYGVDCGNNALLPMLALPHTGAVVTRDQPDRLSRLTTRLLSAISERQQLLAEHGFADVAEQRAATASQDRLPYLVVLFDRWEGFLAAYDGVDAGVLIDNWQQILQEGTGVGVKVIVSCDRTALTGRMSTLIDDKILLRLVDPGDFVAIGLKAKEVPEYMPAGRGFRSEGTRETQVALLAEDVAGSAQVKALQELGRLAGERAKDVPAALRPFRVDALPARMTLAEARALDNGPVEAEDTISIPVAVGGDTLTLYGFDPIEHGPGILIGGPRRTGRSTVLKTVAQDVLARGWQTVVITPRQSPLRTGLPDEAKLFTLDTPEDEIIAALAELAQAEHSALIVDDLEMLGLDGMLADAIGEHVDALRDKESLLIAAGALEDMASTYRGPAVAIKKSRSGILFAPQSQGDGDLFGIRLQRSMVGAPPVPGRGLLVRSGAFFGVQTVLPD
ncbi:FtsK/SpoIIIE domain-containing protein [uncultured Jatrophihabitans sp.]|uniref:FtsK/SpoIIIE domain-containing protein n=1 Tax=uncultured Jatrophihabitans sp. TaxID=1610747 RepID=UPI0035C9B54F